LLVPANPPPAVSKVADIRTIKDAMREASQLYTELARLGAAMGMLDVGGGLGVDYDGSQGSEVSVNYTMQNYANDVVAIMHDACLQKGVRGHPPVLCAHPEPPWRASLLGGNTEHGT
jgi:arginine decarboxylase-like protein